MTQLFLLGERLPLIFHVRWLVMPLLADELRYLRIREAGILSNYMSLVVLAVENEGCYTLAGATSTMPAS